ncbi:MAG TPA: aldehyde dehydrogenase [Allosphingosinicella sp.]|nr:aldehyde dehydrogenase [Allosphingosinicella sp.]HKY81609.1 aldehyde dehydrogenase [Sphingobium sp.]
MEAETMEAPAKVRPFDPATELSENVRTRFYIDGKWQAPRGTDRLNLISPVTEELTLSVPAGSGADMDAAVTAARRAFDETEWPRLPVSERANYLRKIGKEVNKRLELFERVWTAQVGAPRWFVNAILPIVADMFDYYADLAETYPFEEERPVKHGKLKIVREPIGVAALIVPWNTPLGLLIQKVAPALLSGCTAIAKPSPETPLDALILAECIEAAGVPAGVYNVVPADREASNTLISDPRVDKVAFTGSVAAGRHIGAICADRIGRFNLELGGKSASIVCDDADFDLWMKTLSPFVMPFSGQICFSQTRVIVPRRRHNEFIDAYVARVESIKVGDPSDPETEMGPVSMARQRDRVLDYIEAGRQEGAKVVTGGGKMPGFSRGYFIAPTIFDNVTNDMRIAREEIFGPVASVLSYDSDEEAIAIANDSDYGLSGSVFSGDQERAERIARRLRTGHVSTNGFFVDIAGPFGGYKKSGVGSEGGPEGLGGYLETKSLFSPA